MITVPEHAHMAAALVDVPADFALDRLASAAFVGGWSLGSLGLTEAGPGLYRGTSLFDGTEMLVDIRPAPAHGLIDYGVGNAETRSPRIFIRVTPGPVVGRAETVCLITLHALRSAEATTERWARTCIAHEAEILLIKGQLEQALSADSP
ncbi:MAG: hypothetical protein JJU40_13525 [Rhodobacteraceae bacterium]|nr:hypothetical protein [Paracoccaceae bacterium]